MAISKKVRQLVYDKYDGHCAYCGKHIEIKDMQVDHMIPQNRIPYIHRTTPDYAIEKYKQIQKEMQEKVNAIENLMPSCRRCNHYKRAEDLETYRKNIMTIQDRMAKDYLFKVALDYGVVEVKPFNGVFYFEKIEADRPELTIEDFLQVEG